ncbi:hypothetical protein [Streptomyces zagrosensis]|uniref:ABC transporter permease n=1 Tax=Streptomyces zagrosensis TaxID=1042984 RepID=A0A7W9UWG8_9ACTN|nr:hypothetical protein [Streptomyces zagrosensis]MBB5933512.1 hypothetical protein [Streptomyces zagrosensis]
MTAPLTPSDQPSPDSGPQPPAQSQPQSGPPAAADDPHAGRAHGAGRSSARPGTRSELRDAAIITVAVAVAGVILGLLWVWLAPRVQMVADGNVVYLKNSEGEEAIGGDGTFVLIALGLGLLTAALVFWFRRTGGVPLVLALAIGGLLASWLGWRLGVRLGPETDLAVSAREAGNRVPFDGPLELKAKGALLAWPVAAMVMQLILSGLWGPRDPEPQEAEHLAAGPGAAHEGESSWGAQPEQPAPPGQQPAPSEQPSGQPAPAARPVQSPEPPHGSSAGQPPQGS